MSKAIEATCAAGVVKVGALPVEGAVIFSEGVGSSQGIVIMEGGEKFYFAKITPDLKTTIEKTADALVDVVSALNEIATALTTIATVPSGWVTPPASVAANVAIIISKAAEITAGSAALTTLKGVLK